MMGASVQNKLFMLVGFFYTKYKKKAAPYGEYGAAG